MVLLILAIVVISILDIRYLVPKKKKKDLYVYIFLMLLVTALGIFYYSDTERISISEALLLLAGKKR